MLSSKAAYLKEIGHQKEPIPVPEGLGRSLFPLRIRKSLVQSLQDAKVPRGTTSSQSPKEDWVKFGDGKPN